MKAERKHSRFVPKEERPPELYGKKAAGAFEENEEKTLQMQEAEFVAKLRLKEEAANHGPMAPKAVMPNHLETTYNVKSVYPFTGEGGLGGDGVYIGRDLYGAAFCFDPFVLYSKEDQDGQRILNDSSMIIAGDKGSGKSSLVKTYVERNLLFGRHAAIVDPDGEYGGLARVFGVEPLRIEPFGEIRLNPLDPRIAGTEGKDERFIRAKQSGLLRGIIELMHRGQQMTSEHGAALDLALTEVNRDAQNRTGETTIPQLIDKLMYPSEDMAESIRMTPNQLLSYSRSTALDLKRFVDGDLAGMFDAPTSKSINLDQPLVVADLSAIPQEPDSVAIVMAFTSSWMQGMWAKDDGKQRIFVMDEAYKVLANENIGVHAQSSWKGGRKKGQQNIAVVQHLEDFSSVGDDGSRTAKLARGLLADSPTKVIYHQDTTVLENLQSTLRLTSTERAFVGAAAPGRALWKVGDRHSFAVEHRRSPFEESFSNTNKRMEGSQDEEQVIFEQELH